jgi:hypothetical protein
MKQVGLFVQNVHDTGGAEGEEDEDYKNNFR